MDWVGLMRKLEEILLCVLERTTKLGDKEEIKLFFSCFLQITMFF